MLMSLKRRIKTADLPETVSSELTNGFASQLKSAKACGAALAHQFTEWPIEAPQALRNCIL